MVFCLHLVKNNHLNTIRKPNSIIVHLDRCKLARFYLIPCFSVNRSGQYWNVQSGICSSNSVVIHRVVICSPCYVFRQQLGYSLLAKLTCEIFCHSFPNQPKRLSHPATMSNLVIRGFFVFRSSFCRCCYCVCVFFFCLVSGVMSKWLV